MTLGQIDGFSLGSGDDLALDDSPVVASILGGGEICVGSDGSPVGFLYTVSGCARLSR